MKAQSQETLRSGVHRVVKAQSRETLRSGSMDGNIPGEVTIIDKSVNERLKLFEQLEEEDKNAIFRIIDGMLTKSKFKDFFNKNVAML